MEDDELSMLLDVETLDTDEDVMTITRSEARALLEECRYSYISYMNPVARQLISRLMKWADELA